MTTKFNKNAPLVSVVMPNYNSEGVLEVAIQSVLSQTYKNLELIIVDDFSSDDSRSVIAKFSSLDSRIIPVYKERNEGAAMSRNTALDLVQGDYIAFLDSDDCWVDNKIESQVKFMLNNNYRFVYSSYDVISTAGEHCYNLCAPSMVNKRKLLLSNFIGCSTVVVASSLVGEMRQRNIPCRNDYMFWLDLLKDGEMANRCPGVFSSYRKGVGISSNKLRNLKFYCYVIKNSSALGLLLLPIIAPIFLTINLFKKRFIGLYNKFVVKL
ncbi:glycosyltransferase family 2 protein [Porticoccaceae bacterium]|nr:glycosyltransferase family 2 protein [Porticoccaceae bacterium]